MNTPKDLNKDLTDKNRTPEAVILRYKETVSAIQKKITTMEQTLAGREKQEHSDEEHKRELERWFIESCSERCTQGIIKEATKVLWQERNTHRAELELLSKRHRRFLDKSDLQKRARPRNAHYSGGGGSDENIVPPSRSDGIDSDEERAHSFDTGPRNAHYDEVRAVPPSRSDENVVPSSRACSSRRSDNKKDNLTADRSRTRDRERRDG